MKTECPKELVERFRVTRALGEGGMGAVFLGTQPGLDRPVALKILRIDAADDRERIERFQKEAKALASVEHQNLVRLYDYGVVGGHYYLAMEFVQGPTLARMIRKKGPLAAADAQTIMLCIAEALQAIHETGILHRDVKPDNIMIDETGRPVLMDLGLARIAEGPGKGTDSLDGKVVGTVYYMSPEVARTQGAKPCSDWYSWGATLYEAIDGEPPYSKAEILAAVRQKTAWPLPRKPECGPEAERLAALACWCLRGGMDKRPKNFAELKAAALGEFTPPVALWNSASPRKRRKEETRTRGTTLATRGTRALGFAGLLGLTFAAGWWAAGPGPAPLATDGLLRMVVAEPGVVSPRLARSAPEPLFVEFREEGQEAVRQFPVGTGAGETFSPMLPFQARVVSAAGVAGAWLRFPAPPFALPRVLEYQLVPGGAILLGSGEPPGASARLDLAGPPSVPPSQVTTVPGYWLARFGLPDEGRGHAGELSLGTRGGYEIRAPLPGGLVGSPPASARRLAETLKAHAGFVTDRTPSAVLDLDRRLWLRLRSYGLAAWPTLGSGERDLLALLLERLGTEEDGEIRWTRAACFKSDLALVDPAGARMLAARLNTQKEPPLLFHGAVRTLRTLAFEGRVDPPLETVDRSFVRNPDRAAFLPSPYVSLEPRVLIAWTLWGHWQHYSVVREGVSTHNVISRFADVINDNSPAGARAPPVQLRPPMAETLPDQAVLALETELCWRVLAEIDPGKAAPLATILIEGLLPNDGTPLPASIRDALADRLERLVELEDRAFPTRPLTGFLAAVEPLRAAGARGSGEDSERSRERVERLWTRLGGPR